MRSTSKQIPLYDTATDFAREKLVPVIYHNYTETVKRKLVFVAPREAGHWQLWDSFDARENVLAEVERAKAQDYLVEIVVTDDDVDTVAKMLHKRSAAFHRAGLGPDRRPPLVVKAPVALTAPARRILKLKKRGRPRKKVKETPVTSSAAPPAPSAPSAAVSPSQPQETPKEQEQQKPAEQSALLQPEAAAPEVAAAPEAPASQQEVA